jgi:hypothetical protein
MKTSQAIYLVNKLAVQCTKDEDHETAEALAMAGKALEDQAHEFKQGMANQHKANPIQGRTGRQLLGLAGAIKSNLK